MAGSVLKAARLARRGFNRSPDDHGVPHLNVGSPAGQTYLVSCKNVAPDTQRDTRYTRLLGADLGPGCLRHRRGSDREELYFRRDCRRQRN